MLLFSYCNLVFLTIVLGRDTPILSLKINEQDPIGNSFYSVYINSNLWLQSGQLNAYFNAKWFTTNNTLINNTNNNYSAITLISQTQSSGIDTFGGSYSSQIFKWMTSNNIEFSTIFKVYDDGEAISFIQSFPNEVTGINLVDESTCPITCGYKNEPPFLSFPSFTLSTDNMYANGNSIGYLTFHDTFSKSEYGKTPIPNDNLSGNNGGPVVLYNYYGNETIIISSNDNFGISTQYNVDMGSLDWQLGITSSLLSVPDGFEHETVIVVGNGINQVMTDKWSSKLKKKYNTNRLSGDDDIITAFLGYWTDHGGYYYGDDYIGATEIYMNLTCCSYDVLSDVKSNLDAENIPIRYLQMDDWWYKGDYAADRCWFGVKAVKEWTPPKKYYPGGLYQLSSTLNVPLLLYGPYLQPKNQWNGQFEFIPQGTDYVLPAPQQSYEFYDVMFKFGINATTNINNKNTGMIGFEVDFMSCLSTTPYFRLNVNKQQQWLDGMNLAAKENGLSIQYCMASPMNLMQSLSLSQVTNGRASNDYSNTNNWNIGVTSLLFWSLDLKPSKDQFWTSFNEPLPKDFINDGPDKNSTEIHAIIAILSCGPVGIGDASKWSNKTLIYRLINEYGRLLQPKRPITAIDQQFIEKIKNNMDINIWSTEMGPNNMNNIYTMVLAIDLHSNYPLNYDSFYPNQLDPNYNYIVRDWHLYKNCMNNSKAIENHCIEMVSSNSNNNLYTLTPKPIIYPMLHSFQLIHIVQADFNNIILLGELNKYVSVSEHRFANLETNGQTQLSVDIIGKPEEMVEITLLIPIQGIKDWFIQTFSVKIDYSGVTSFDINI